MAATSPRLQLEYTSLSDANSCVGSSCFFGLHCADLHKRRYFCLIVMKPPTTPQYEGTHNHACCFAWSTTACTPRSMQLTRSSPRQQTLRLTIVWSSTTAPLETLNCGVPLKGFGAARADVHLVSTLILPNQPAFRSDVCCAKYSMAETYESALHGRDSSGQSLLRSEVLAQRAGVLDAEAPV
jgi:hypothetical protein